MASSAARPVSHVTNTPSEHLFEIRYKPNARILDKRGYWAEELCEHMRLPHWKINPNRLDVFDETTRQRGFVSFTNAGYQCENGPTHTFFADKAVKYFKFVLELEAFPNPLFIDRIGVRQKFITPYLGTFDHLVHKFSERYLKLTDPALAAIDAKLIDIGAPLNFADKHGNFNTLCGPMPKAQSDELMSNDTAELPEIGLFFDIDYWIRPRKQWSGNDILKAIRTFAIEGWRRHDQVKNLILQD